MDQIVISASNLTKIFLGKEVIRNCTFSVERGSIYGFLGRNGAGKTTVLKLLLGLLKPSAGTASVLGLDSVRDNEAILRRTGSLIETPIFYEHLSAADNLRLHLAYMGMADADVDQHSAVWDRPVQRASWKKVLCAKLVLVFAYTAGAMLLCGAVVQAVFFLTESLFPLSSDQLTVEVVLQSLGSLLCCSILAGLLGVVSLWFGFRKKLISVTIVASVVLATIVCQRISSELAFLPMMGAVLGVTGILAALAVKNLLRQVNNMEV